MTGVSGGLLRIGLQVTGQGVQSGFISAAAACLDDALGLSQQQRSPCESMKHEDC